MDINLLALLDLIERTSLRPSLPVEIEPQIFITHWSIYEAEFRDGTKSRHVVGRHLEKGRASTAIQSFDSDMKRFTTRSGRIYQLKAMTLMLIIFGLGGAR